MFFLSYKLNRLFFFPKMPSKNFSRWLHLNYITLSIVKCIIIQLHELFIFDFIYNQLIFFFY